MLGQVANEPKHPQESRRTNGFGDSCHAFRASAALLGLEPPIDADHDHVQEEPGLDVVASNPETSQKAS